MKEKLFDYRRCSGNASSIFHYDRDGTPLPILEITAEVQRDESIVAVSCSGHYTFTKRLGLVCRSALCDHGFSGVPSFLSHIVMYEMV